MLHIEIDIILSGVDGHARSLAESPMILTITLSLLENNQMEISSAALNRAEEAINMIATWSSAVDVIKQVMNAVSLIAAVCTISFCLLFAVLTLALQLQPYASLAWSLLSKIPEVCHVALSGDMEYSLCFHLASRL